MIDEVPVSYILIRGGWSRGVQLFDHPNPDMLPYMVYNKFMRDPADGKI